MSHSNDNNFQVSCFNASDGYIRLTISGGSGNYTYLWAGPDGYSATTKDISGLKAGNYICTVTDINGCNLIPQPAFTLTQPDQLVIASLLSPSADGSYNISCNGATGSVDVSVTGGSAGSYTYVWSTTDGSGIATGQQDQNSLTAGTYHLIVTDYNGCITSKDITLTQPSALITDMVPTHITCQVSGFNNGSINLNVSGGIGPYLYSWSTGATVQDISGLSVGRYFVTVTDANGCMKTDSVLINLPPPLTYDQVLPEYNWHDNCTENGNNQCTEHCSPKCANPGPSSQPECVGTIASRRWTHCSPRSTTFQSVLHNLAASPNPAQAAGQIPSAVTQVTTDTQNLLSALSSTCPGGVATVAPTGASVLAQLRQFGNKVPSSGRQAV